MELNIVKSLEYLRPNASWTLIDDDYASLEWLDPVQTKPTLEEIQAVQVEVENMINDQKRMEDYRRNSDPIFFQYQRGEKTKEQWDASVAAVRSRHPNKT